MVLLAAMSVSATVLLIVIALVWWIDRYDREPLHLVVMVYLWGASAAPPAAVLSFPFLEDLYQNLSLSRT
jgi:RsiW-degrading membrane proteinase PrsW (M82 family)